MIMLALFVPTLVAASAIAPATPTDPMRAITLLAQWGNAGLGGATWILPTTLTVSFALAAFCAATSRYVDDDDDSSARQVYAALGCVIAGLILTWMALTVLTIVRWQSLPQPLRPSHGTAAVALFALGGVCAVVGVSAGRFWWSSLEHQQVRVRRALRRTDDDIAELEPDVPDVFRRPRHNEPSGPGTTWLPRYTARLWAWCAPLSGLTLQVTALGLMSTHFLDYAPIWPQLVFLLLVSHAISSIGGSLLVATSAWPSSLRLAPTDDAPPIDGETTPTRAHRGVFRWAVCGCIAVTLAGAAIPIGLLFAMWKLAPAAEPVLAACAFSLAITVATVLCTWTVRHIGRIPRRILGYTTRVYTLEQLKKAERSLQTRIAARTDATSTPHGGDL